MNTTIGELAARDKPCVPIAVYTYNDKIAFWIEREFNEDETAYIKSQCGPGGTDLDRPAHKSRFDPRLIRRVETRQPSPELFVFLASVEGTFLNQAEFTLDLIFDTEENRDHAFEFFNWHSVKRGHRGKVRYYKKTRYTDRRWAPTNLVAYRPEFAKLTGEVFCLHVEWRVCGVAALRRMEIDGIKDLINFDHRALWQRRLRLCTFDFARLGRVYSNGLTKKRRQKTRTLTARKPRVYVTRRGFEYHTDRRLGQHLLRINETVQGVINFAKKQNISVARCLTDISNDAWLPQGVMK
jgi:hypothetical protein